MGDTKNEITKINNASMLLLPTLNLDTSGIGHEINTLHEVNLE